jgi:hypothetical protein
MISRIPRASLALAVWIAACSSSGNHGSGASTSSGPSGTGGAQTTSTGPAPDGGPGGAPASGLGAAPIDPGDLDPPSDGATITFEQIGAAGWYPSRRDPATGPCDALDANGCCMTKHTIASDQLTPWDEDLIMTLRGPMVVKQLAVYQPAPGDPAHWALASGWDSRQPGAPQGMAFNGKATPAGDFAGVVGSECLVDVSTATPFPCGPGSVPYCPSPPPPGHEGWAGSKLFVILATMPHAGTSKAPAACSTTTTGNWYDAPWVGLAVGELPRAGSFASCQCFAKDPAKWYLADGCGQFNVFEVVNDHNQYTNLDVFSTDLIDYSGYVGEGPCGPKCDVSKLAAGVDLIDKATDQEAAKGAVATPSGGPGAAFRRPGSGYRYFLIALDVASRTVQLAVVHPQQVPASIAPLLPGLPASIPQATVDAVLGMRLPK